MLFWGSLSKSQLPEDKLFLKTFGSCCKSTCQRKLCVPILWEPLETFLLLLSAPLCFLKQVTIVFTRQEISSLASFFLHQGCFFCFPAFPFANITGFYFISFLIMLLFSQQPLQKPILPLEISEKAISHHLKEPPDSCMLKSTSTVCRAFLETSLAAGSSTPEVIIVCGVQTPNWQHLIQKKDEFLSSNMVKNRNYYVYTYSREHKSRFYTIKPTLKQATKGLVLWKHGIILICPHVQVHTHTLRVVSC